MNIRLLISVMSACLGSFVWAQTASEYSLEFGLQDVKITGNSDLFRSQVNQDDGLFLSAFTYNLIDGTSRIAGLDRLRIDASGFGALAHGHIRIQASKAKSYDLRLKFISMDQFNALPNYANPFLNENIVPGQHTYDRSREILDFSLELRSGRSWRPLIQFRQVEYSGPARSTYHIGQDEFAIANVRDDMERELRLGLAFDIGKFSGQILQGWRESDTEERVELLPGANAGNNIREILGREIEVDSIDRLAKTESSAPTTTLHLSGPAHERIGLMASYVRTHIESDVEEEENIAGRLASFQISRFYNGLNQTVTSSPDVNLWRAHFQADIMLPAQLKWRISWSNTNRKLDGQALITSLYTDVMTFGNQDRPDFINQLEARNYLERSEEFIETELVTSDINGFRFWGGFSFADLESIVEPDLAELVVPGGQGGTFVRETDGIRLGAQFKKKSHLLKVEWENKDADNIIMRTDYQSWSKFSTRIKSRISKNIRFSAKAIWLDQENDHPEIGYKSDYTNYGTELSFQHKRVFDAGLSYGVYDYESEVTFIQPQDFSSAQSFHQEDGVEFDLHARLSIKKYELAANYTEYDSEGVLDFYLERIAIRASYEITKSLGVTLEFVSQDYKEEGVPFAAYQSETVAALLRWNP